MTEPTRQIRVVLDRSAIESYALGHAHVRDVLVAIGDEKAANVGIPAAALAEAYGRAPDEVTVARLGILTSLPGVAVVDLDGENAADVGNVATLIHVDLPQAHAVWTAFQHCAFFLTAEPEMSVRMVPIGRIIEIPAEDA
ncbi:hypothetical protein [Actinoplanes sp. NPDC051494]|uniref:hypothetical protein n=1 Tax=Actinoplanes sp. NPDC051494 TaxID=3363907 RepID=UPI003799CB74